MHGKKRCLAFVIDCLFIVFRVTLSTKQTEWADIVVPIGGDGTFLLTASRACPIFCKSKPIIGFNSDPDRSEGRLMLSKHYSNDPKEAVRKLIQVGIEIVSIFFILLSNLPLSSVNINNFRLFVSVG